MIKLNVLAAAALALTCTLTQAATIDRMNTATFGGYSQSFMAGSEFMVFGQASNYELNDGTTWTSGAGWHPTTYSTLSGVTTNGASVTYTFNTPASGLLFQNTDYDSGDHSAQGELGAPASLTIVAPLGGTTGVMSGYTKIVSNTETWYGQPKFNYYSAPVGSYVYFEQRFSLTDTTFTADLFNRNFNYNEEGFVDFTHTQSVPEPSTAVLSLLGLLVVGKVNRSKKAAKSAQGARTEQV